MQLDTERRQVVAGILLRTLGFDGHADDLYLTAQRLRTRGTPRERAIAATAIDLFGPPEGETWRPDGARLGEILDAGGGVTRLVGSLLVAMADGEAALDKWISSTRGCP